MTDLKTTVTGFITAATTILASFNVIIPQEWIPVILSVGVLVMGWFASDKPKV